MECCMYDTFAATILIKDKSYYISYIFIFYLNIRLVLSGLVTSIKLLIRPVSQVQSQCIMNLQQIDNVCKKAQTWPLEIINAVRCVTGSHIFL